MVSKWLIFSLLLVSLGSLHGCIIHDPGYYPYDRDYYSESYYPLYYGPYFYTPFWFSGYYYFGGVGREHGPHGHREFEGRGGGRGHR